MKDSASQYKIAAGEEMIVNALPPLDQHPGKFIRDVLLPEYGLKISHAAQRLGVNRPGFTRVLDGDHDVSRDLAYKLGALMNDAVADFLIAYQHAYDLAKEREKREAYKETIERMPPVQHAA